MRNSIRRTGRYALLLVLVASGAIASAPAGTNPCRDCKDECRDDRNDQYRKCLADFGTSGGLALTKCLESANEGYTRCLDKECYAQIGGPCVPKRDPVTASGVAGFDAGNPRGPRADEFVIDVPQAGTYFLDAVNLGDPLPVPDLFVSVDGQPAIDDRGFGTRAEASYPILLNAGRNRLVVSSTGKGYVTLFVSAEPLAER